MHILANVEAKVHILFLLIFSPEFVTFGGVTMGEGANTKDDKMWHKEAPIDFLSDILFNGPYRLDFFTVSLYQRVWYVLQLQFENLDDFISFCKNIWSLKVRILLVTLPQKYVFSPKCLLITKRITYARQSAAKI